MRAIYTLAVVSVLVIFGQVVLSGGEGLVGEKKATITILDDPLGGFVVLKYKMGNSIHEIKYSSISAIVYTNAGHTVYFGGGQLRNNIDIEGYKLAVKKYLEKKDAER